MGIELLDCSFCGGKAESALYTHNKISNGVAVRCSSCGGSTERLIYKHDDVKFLEVVERLRICKVKAAELWNKRSN